MVAMTFAVGASIGIVRAGARHRLARLLGWPMRIWLLGVGGLFGYHALYFAALQLAPPAEANLVNYLWPLLIVLLSAPLAGERLAWPHLLGAFLGFAGVILLAFGRGLSFTGAHALGYALALGCAFIWSLYSVLSRRFGETPTDAVAAFCCGVGPAVVRLPSPVRAHGVAGHDDGVARRAGDRPRPCGPRVPISGTTPSSAATSARSGRSPMPRPILSTALLIVCGLAEPTGTLLIAAALVTVGAVLASREQWRR